MSYECEHCERTFSRNSSLKSHLRKHVVKLEAVVFKPTGSEWRIDLNTLHGHYVRFNKQTGLETNPAGFLRTLKQIVNDDLLWSQIKNDSAWSRSLTEQVLRKKGLAA